MCRNISNMRLALFAVVLILPVFEGEGFGVDNCFRALLRSGNKYCERFGYGKYNGWIFGLCELGCGDQRVPLPKKACPNGTMHNPCTEEELEHLQKWAKNL
ncbi:uncharacterized protein LOC120836514 [Ixodes scapularis]|uniref:uncharacterized protein LOC120836514 n=1 Tax=Ixodes scapularis TaxID=6945 RepID=UPI001C393A06|nr:uncharacterized protein LOC120836514 [Ixodes scapularis]